jgi:hypothetical protein
MKEVLSCRVRFDPSPCSLTVQARSPANTPALSSPAIPPSKLVSIFPEMDSRWPPGSCRYTAPIGEAKCFPLTSSFCLAEDARNHFGFLGSDLLPLKYVCAT